MTGRPAPGRGQVPGPSGNPPRGSGRLDDPITWTVGASTDREPARDASRICAAPLRAHGASTQQPPRGSQHLAHARGRRVRERCRLSFRQCTGWLGQDDCESSNRKIAQRASGHRTRRQVRRWSVGHDAPSHLSSWQVPAHRTSHSVGRGAYAICALPYRMNISCRPVTYVTGSIRLCGLLI
jgi:hypothetical protein